MGVLSGRRDQFFPMRRDGGMKIVLIEPEFFRLDHQALDFLFEQFEGFPSSPVGQGLPSSPVGQGFPVSRS